MKNHFVRHFARVASQRSEYPASNSYEHPDWATSRNILIGVPNDQSESLVQVESKHGAEVKCHLFTCFLLELFVFFLELSPQENMQACISTIQVTPPMEDKSALPEHILWAPKKKKNPYRRRIRGIVVAFDKRAVHSRCRKRLVFKSDSETDELEREVREEASKSASTNKGKSKEESIPKTPNCKVAREEHAMGVSLLRRSKLSSASRQGRPKSHENIRRRKLSLSNFR